MLAAALLLTVSAFAAEPKAAPEVRVNGYLVEFPDAQPYINDDLRTMIPVRFVGEALGADVSWSHIKQGAVIKKDGITIILPVGTNQMIVNRDGKETTKELDTRTVLQNGRTFVPIRAVAEELGAWVSFAKAYNTVVIYDDILSPSEIEQIHALPIRDYWVGIAPDAEKAICKSSSAYEDLSEIALRAGRFKLDFEAKGFSGATYNTKTDSTEDRIDYLVKEINYGMAKQYTREEYGITAEFRTDASCTIVNPGSKTKFLNLGYLTIHVAKDANIERYAYFKKAYDHDFAKILKPGNTYTFILETNYEFMAGGRVDRLAVVNRTNGVNERWS